MATITVDIEKINKDKSYIKQIYCDNHWELPYHYALWNGDRENKVYDKLHSSYVYYVVVEQHWDGTESIHHITNDSKDAYNFNKSFLHNDYDKVRGWKIIPMVLRKEYTKDETELTSFQYY